MKRLTAKFHIALGQTGLLASLLLVAIYLGLVPDRVGAIREGRATLAEAIAANSSAFISQADKVNCLSTIALKHKEWYLDETPDIPIINFNFQPRSPPANENGAGQSGDLKGV